MNIFQLFMHHAFGCTYIAFTLRGRTTIQRVLITPNGQPFTKAEGDACPIRIQSNGRIYVDGGIYVDGTREATIVAGSINIPRPAGSE